MSSVTFEAITKRYEHQDIIKGVDLQIRDGEFMVFVGPSGCGKSTLLRLVAGLEEVSSGELRIGDQVANDIPAARRGVAMVFQSYALYPHMTVAENMGFSLRMAGLAKAQIRDQVARAAEILQITDLLGRMPKALSGGQRQRVAIGRAIVRKPGVFLFDEPLSNLDAGLRVQMRLELAKLHRELATTMIYVTHDQTEAMTLGDRIAVINGGRIEQTGRPMELYQRPANRFVAQFLGSPRMNLLPASPGPDGRLILAGQAQWTVPLPESVNPAACAEVGIRPECLRQADPGTPGGWTLQVDLVERLGDSTLLYGLVPGLAAPICAKAERTVAEPGAIGSVTLRPEPGTLHLFDRAGQRIATV
jgi:multiple sugar transport system ATP-binding protein